MLNREPSTWASAKDSASAGCSSVASDGPRRGDHRTGPWCQSRNSAPRGALFLKTFGKGSGGYRARTGDLRLAKPEKRSTLRTPTPPGTGLKRTHVPPRGPL